MKWPRVEFHGVELWLDPQGVAWAPQHGALIASDLHFEKGSFLARHGSLIPPYDTQDTLERLETLVQHYAPQQLVLLGDSFHDCAAWLRLDDALRQRILALTHAVPTVWVEGNHDAVLQEHGLGHFVAQHRLGDVVLVHEPDDVPQPQMIGHYHPKARVSVGAGKVSGRCFVCADKLFVMPSFGSYTGGLDVRSSAFRALLGGVEPAIYLMHGDGVYAIPARGKPLP